jgi:hypothetical protein
MGSDLGQAGRNRVVVARHLEQRAQDQAQRADHQGRGPEMDGYGTNIHHELL